MTKPNTGTELSNHRQQLSNTKNKGLETINRDLVTAKTNSFPKAYINRGKLTVGEEAVSSYKHLTPISIRILGTGNSHQPTSYDPVIVAYSILLALQYADSTARLVIWKYNGSENFATLPQVRSYSDITKDNIADFMEDPRVNQKNNSFSGRVCILTDYNLNKLKKNEEVRSWLNSEKVYLTENNLSTVTTTPAGFITGWAPRNIQTVHERRLASVLQNEPEFLVEYKWITDGAKETCKVTMIRCAQNDVARLTKALQQLDPACGFTFHTWDYYSSLSMRQKRRLIQTENAYTRVPWKSFALSDDEQKHDKTRPQKVSNISTTTMTHLKENNNCMIYEESGPNSTLPSVIAYSEQHNSQLCKNAEVQALITNINSNKSEIKELQEKNRVLTATVSRLEQLITTIQHNMTATQTSMRDTIEETRHAMAMTTLAVTANDQALIELNSTTIPAMNSGFSNTIAMIKQMTNLVAAPIKESQTTITKQATTTSPIMTHSVNSLYCIDDENETVNVTNEEQTTVYNNETTKPRKLCSNREFNVEDSKTDYRQERDNDKTTEARKVLSTNEIRSTGKDSFLDNIDRGFANMRDMFRQMPKWEASPITESPPKTNRYDTKTTSQTEKKGKLLMKVRHPVASNFRRQLPYDRGP
jgi:hypothetical protein